MNERYYVLETKITSQGTETRNFTPYDSLTTAQRKYHEALTGIGAGSKRICVALLNQYLDTINKEVWTEPISIETPSEE